jgi:hypothetical protein
LHSVGVREVAVKWLMVPKRVKWLVSQPGSWLCISRRSECCLALTKTRSHKEKPTDSRARPSIVMLKLWMWSEWGLEFSKLSLVSFVSLRENYFLLYSGFFFGSLASCFLRAATNSVSSSFTFSGMDSARFWVSPMSLPRS